MLSVCVYPLVHHVTFGTARNTPPECTRVIIIIVVVVLVEAVVIDGVPIATDKHIGDSLYTILKAEL